MRRCESLRHEVLGFIAIKTRSRLGLYQLSMMFPQVSTRERRSKSYRSALGGVVLRPWLWPHAFVYAAIS